MCMVGIDSQTGFNSSCYVEKHHSSLIVKAVTCFSAKITLPWVLLFAV